jgi:queuosine precursor transporter
MGSPAPAGPPSPADPGGFDARTRVYIWLTAIFVTCLLIADITGSKFFHFNLFTIGSYTFVTHSAGMLSFPITFLLTDLVNEYYGKRGARRMTYVGLAMAALAFVLIFCARKLPADAGSPIPQGTFEAVFAMSNRLYVASLTAFLVGQLADIFLFGQIKRLTGGRLVWLRATGSTVVSQALDSFLVSTILLYGVSRPDGSVWTMPRVLEVAATGYILKFFIALGLTPLIYLGRKIIHDRFGLQPLPPEPR